MRVIIMLLLSSLFVGAAEDTTAQLLKQAESWYSAKPSERDIAVARGLVEQCVFEQGRTDRAEEDHPLDTALNTILMLMASDGTKATDTFVVNTCDHLFLRYGDNYVRFLPLMDILYVEPEKLNFWPPAERKAHLLRRLPLLTKVWTRINTGAHDVLPPDQLPLLNIAKPSDPTLTVEERAKAWDRYFEARDLNSQRARQALQQTAFQNAKDSGVESLQTWLRQRCLPEDAGLMRDFLIGCGFSPTETEKMVGNLRQ